MNTEKPPTWRSAMTRRTLAGTAAAAVPLALAGCTSTSETPPPRPTEVGADDIIVIRGSGDPERDGEALRSGFARVAREPAPIILLGTFHLQETFTVPSNSVILGGPAQLRQTAPLTTIFRTNGGSNIVLERLHLSGVGSDYTNSAKVFAASGIYVNKGSKSVRITDCDFTNIAGVAVILEGADRVYIRGCTIVGPGKDVIRGSSYNYSAGIVAHTNGGRWAAELNDISGYAQGIVTDPWQVSYQIIGNKIHEIPGQHGLYLESVNRGVIQANIIWNTNLLGMKIQVPEKPDTSSADVVVADNVFQNVGDAGILLTNIGGTTARLNRVVVSSNVIDTAGADGVTLNSSTDVIIHDNIITGTHRAGISVRRSSGIEIHHNRLSHLGADGIKLVESHDWTVDFNRVDRPAMVGRGAAINVSATCTDGAVRGNRLSGASTTTSSMIISPSTAKSKPAGVIYERNLTKDGHEIDASIHGS